MKIFARTTLSLALLCAYHHSFALSAAPIDAHLASTSNTAAPTGNSNQYKQEDAMPTATLDAITVKVDILGDSSMNDVKDFSGARTVLDNAAIKRTAATSVDTALQFVPGVKVQDETGTGVLPNVSVRGLGASRSGQAQFLMDGVPLTLAPYSHTGQSIFPATLDNIDRIDVVRGGAATQYGPNNVGGVINLITKPILSDTHSEIASNVTLFEENSKPLTSLYAQHSRWLTDDLGVQIEANLLTGDSFRDHSATDVTNIQAKALWYIDDNQELEGFLQYYHADTEMPGALAPTAYKSDIEQSQRPFENYDGESTRWHAKYKNHLNIGHQAILDITTFGHHANRNFEWGFNSQFKDQGVHWADPAVPADSRRTSPRKFDVYGVEPKFSVQFGNDETISHHVMTGVRYVNEDIDYRLRQTNLSTGVTTVPRDWHLDTDAWAAYISDEIGFMDNRLKLTPGIRYENADMTFDDLGKDSQDDNSITEWLPGLTASYDLLHSDDALWTVYGNTQKSLRAPQIAYIRGKGEEGSELAWNYELGSRYTTDNLQANIALYRIDFDDQLQWNSADQSFDNVGHTLHQGIETAISYQPDQYDNLDLGMSYNYLDATLEDGVFKGNRLPYSSKHQVGWHASYNYADWRSTLSGFYYSKAYADNANTSAESLDGAVGETPDYMVWNLDARKTLMNTDDEKLIINLGINNLFDEDYYFRGIDTSPVGRYPAPRRAYKIGLNYQF